MKPVTENLANGWQVNLHPHREILSRSVVQQGLDLIKRWVPLFPVETTWVQNTYKVPSLFLRIDFVLDEDGRMWACEVEDRPCGPGLLNKKDPHFATILARMRAGWPPFRWVIDPDRVTDDEGWLGPGLSYNEAMESEGLLLLRNRPGKSQYRALADRAVSTVWEEGNKRCFADLGLLQEVRWVSDPSDEEGGYLFPPVTRPVVIKPAQGTRSNEIEVYLRGVKWPHKKRSGDTLGFEAFLKRIQGGGVVCQPFFPPMRCEFLGSQYKGWNMIYRCFYGFDSKASDWVCMGGMWMALDSLIVHGTAETITGPLHVE